MSVCPLDYELTPLACAVRRGQVDVARNLYTSGADASWRNPDGWSLPHYAVFGGLDAVLFVLSLGLDVNARNNNDWTPLMLSMTTAMTRCLIQYGANVNAVDKEGRSALHNAAMVGRDAVCVALIFAGTDVTRRNKYGHTAAELAPELARFFYQHSTAETIERAVRCRESRRRAIRLYRALLVLFRQDFDRIVTPGEEGVMIPLFPCERSDCLHESTLALLLALTNVVE